jgi:peptide/nickel transport system substrate-binding protein
MRKSIWLMLIAALVVGLVAAATVSCGKEESTATTVAGTSAGEPVLGGIAKTGTVSHPSKFGFPARVFGPDQWFEGLFLEMMFNPTTEIDKYVPALAESWELTSDKSAYIFHLRQGVKFHDGTDFNAAACKFCWELGMSSPPAGPPGPPPGAAGAPPAGAPAAAAATGPPPDFAFVKSIEVVDDYTVKVNLTKWTNQVLSFIGRKSWAVFSPAAYQEHGADWMDTNPVGTGAFKLKSFTPDQIMVLEKNPDYWGKDAQGRQLPYLDGVEVQIFSDPTTELMALQAGQIDGTDQLSTIGAQQLQNDPKFTLNQFEGPVQMIEVNTTDPASVWSDLQMRQALEYAIDKEGIDTSVGLGFTPAVYEIIHSVSQVVDPGTTPRKYDPAKAKELMAAAGHTTVEATLSYDTNRTPANLAEAVQANLAAVGITLKLNGLNTPAFSAISTKVPQGNDMIFQGLRGGPPNVLQGAIEMFGKGTIYFPAFSPPAEFYTLMDTAQTYDNVSEALPDIAKMEKIAYDDAQVVPLNLALFISAVGTRLKNMNYFYANTPTPWFNEAWLAQ